jgi:hypothetical protein
MVAAMAAGGWAPVRGRSDLPTAWAERATTPVPRELYEFPR